MSAVAVAEDRPPAAICDPAAGIGRVAAPDPGLAAARFLRLRPPPAAGPQPGLLAPAGHHRDEELLRDRPVIGEVKEGPVPLEDRAILDGAVVAGALAGGDL